MENENRLMYADDFLDLFYVASAGQDKAFIKSVEMVVEDTPTVDAVEVVHGRWEDEYGGEFANPRYRCSVCKGKSLYRFDRDCLGGWHDVQALTNY